MMQRLSKEAVAELINKAPAVNAELFKLVSSIDVGEAIIFSEEEWKVKADPRKTFQTDFIRRSKDKGKKFSVKRIEEGWAVIRTK